MAWFDAFLSEPTYTFLKILYDALFDNLGLAIIALTLIVRLVILPLTLKQLRSAKAMAEKTRAIQPKLKELQKKYAKNKEKLAHETMKLYKEAGLSPLGCLTSPMLVTLIIQMPIFIALYRAVGFAFGREMNLRFLWLDLSSVDYVLPVLIMASMWVSQKMMTAPSPDPRQESMQKMMQWMMPIMFGIFAFTFPSGLSLYILFTVLFSIVVQYFVYGWENLRAPFHAMQGSGKKVVAPGKQRADGEVSPQTTNPGKRGTHISVSTQTTDSEKHRADISAPTQGYNQEKRGRHGKSRSKRKNR